MKSSPRILPVLLLLVLFSPVPTQSSPRSGLQSGTQNDAADAAHAPDPDSGMPDNIQGLFIPVVPDHPFQAKITVNIVRRLPDGTTVAQKYHSQVARDGKGREYREARDLVPADSDREPPLIRTIVYDPKTSLITNCMPDRHVCRQVSFNPTAHPLDAPEGSSQDGKSVLKRESLGGKTIDGVQVTGTRETTTFVAGAFGNDKPVVVTKEIWYSPELQFNLLVTRDDPRNGTQKFEVTDLKLGEPGEEWFAIPDGYRVVQERMVAGRVWPAQLEPLIEKAVTNISPDQLTADLAPVEEAIGVYVKAHMAGAPHDNAEQFAGQLRMRLSGDLRMMQDIHTPQRAQVVEANTRLKQTYTAVLNSPCIDKPQPGDPPSMPSSAAALEAEEHAWNGVQTAWTGFLVKMFPNGDPGTFAWQITNERASELRRFENTERNRGCFPVESIAPELETLVNGMTPDQLEAAVVPVDAAIAAFAQAHAAASPNDRDESFIRQTEQSLLADVRRQQQDRNQWEGQQLKQADAQLNQTYQSVIASPCLSRPQPGDPPSMPTDEASLRAEERAWIDMRDSWTTFLIKLFPNADRGSLAWQLTSQRTFQLQRIANVERNRGCIPEESIEPLLAGLVNGLSAEQLAAAAKPVNAAINAYVKAHAESAPNDRNEFFARQVEQGLISDLTMQQQNQLPTQDQFEEADLHLNQTYRRVIASQCLAAPIPADPPNAPVSEEKLRDEERAWVALRDAWIKFMAGLYPDSPHAGFGTALTEQRVNELQQIRNIERNRGCRTEEE
jgi:uncharacterized protein YecT (DUF1311 family)